VAEPLFEVRLCNYEPHTPGDDPMVAKRELRDAIINEIGLTAIKGARERLWDKKLSVQVVFSLWEGRADLSDTRSKKDLDNLLKPLLDSLQDKLEAGGKEMGLGLIPNDDLIYEIQAKKEIVKEEAAEGIVLSIFGP